MTEYASWVKCNEWIIDAHERKGTRLRGEQTSQRTAGFIEQKDYLITQGRREEANEMEEQIKKQKKQDKIAWINKLAVEAKKCKDLWDGTREIGQDYKTCTYAKKAMHGNPVPLGERAEVTTNLQKEQWSRSKKQETTAETEAKRSTHKYYQRQT